MHGHLVIAQQAGLLCTKNWHWDLKTSSSGLYLPAWPHQLSTALPRVLALHPCSSSGRPPCVSHHDRCRAEMWYLQKRSVSWQQLT